MKLIKTFFDSLVAPLFKVDSQGRTLFYPAGLWSKGRILPDLATQERLRRRARWAYMAFFFLVIPLVSGPAATGGAAFWWQTMAIALLFGALLTLYFFYEVSGLPVSDEQLSMREAQGAQSLALGRRGLVALAVTSGILTSLGVLMMLLDPQTQFLSGLATAALFGTCVVVFLLQLRRLPAAPTDSKA